MQIEIGNIFYDPNSERNLVIVDVSHSQDRLMAIIQYDDGKPDIKKVEDMKEEFIQCPTKDIQKDSIPVLSEACLEGKHDFDSIDEIEHILNPSECHYSKRCNKCGLSSEILFEFLGHSITASLGNICHNCHKQKERDYQYSDHRDRPICDDCWNKEYNITWEIKKEELQENYACYHQRCGWFSEDVPETKQCPKCGGKLSIISKDSYTYQIVKENMEEVE